METILHLIGASVNTIGFARQYLAIIAIGAPFIMFSTAFANILRGEGASRGIDGRKPVGYRSKYYFWIRSHPGAWLGSDRCSA